MSNEDEAVVHGGSIKAPKVLADIVESIAAAVYVDVNFDLQRLWVVCAKIFFVLFFMVFFSYSINISWLALILDFVDEILSFWKMGIQGIGVFLLLCVFVDL